MVSLQNQFLGKDSPLSLTTFHFEPDPWGYPFSESHELVLDGDYPRYVGLKPDGTFMLTDLSTGPFSADLDGDGTFLTTSAFTVDCDGFVQIFTEAPLVDRNDQTFPWQVTTDPAVGGTTINQPLSPDDFIKVLPVAGVAPVSAARAETVEDSEDEADAAAEAEESPGVLTPTRKRKRRSGGGDGGSGRRRNLWEQRLRRPRWERRADGADGADGGDDAGNSGPAYPRCPAAPTGLVSTVRPGARQPMANGTCAQMGGAKVPNFDFTGCYNCDTGTFDSCNSVMGSCIASTCDQKYPGAAQAAQWAACRISGASYAFAVRAFAGDAFYASNSARCTCRCGDLNTSLCSVSASGSALQCVNVGLGLDANNCGGCGRQCASGICFLGDCFTPPNVQLVQNGRFDNVIGTTAPPWKVASAVGGATIDFNADGDANIFHNSAAINLPAGYPSFSLAQTIQLKPRTAYGVNFKARRIGGTGPCTVSVNMNGNPVSGDQDIEPDEDVFRAFGGNYISGATSNTVISITAHCMRTTGLSIIRVDDVNVYAV
ncbi:hypothetical protein DIS24_g12081 [Lasiodiplodia hormozganensis]|uniref:Uncharacterized protein n=1 Tax=Lasiodiplodia hormozganensis TaxID=869390 RepID=A0AA39TRG0_9PEZI|nr:hypothetical protein DIS24_g12081 [Lasiodiplodia hormozganensis]